MVQAMLTIKQCAENLQISERTIRTMIAENKFCPHKRIGGQLRFCEDDFEEWKNSQEDEKLKYARKKSNRTLNKIKKIIGG